MAHPQRNRLAQRNLALPRGTAADVPKAMEEKWGGGEKHYESEKELETAALSQHPHVLCIVVCSCLHSHLSSQANSSPITVLVHLFTSCQGQTKVM